MVSRRTGLSFLAAACALAASSLLLSAADPERRPNVIIFVADGLRPGSVNLTDAPTLFRLRQDGVNFVNSHSVFPTVTMSNAAAIATGHYPGDTGQFGNNLFIARRLFSTGNFGQPPGTVIPNVENDQVLADINEQFGGNFVREASLLSVARAHGYSTAAVGKIGPTAMQDLPQVGIADGRFTVPSTIVVDGLTGTAAGLPLAPGVAKLIADAGLGTGPPARLQPAGTNATPGSLSANVEHYRWLADATTKAILPSLAASGKPFILVFWCGDPDQTQHAHGDSLNALAPGINGPTSRAAVRNADAVLAQLVGFVDAQPALREHTDIIVTSDHGFSTNSRHELDTARHVTNSYAAGFSYRDLTGRQEVNQGYLPQGALAIDLAHGLGLPLYAPDAQVNDEHGMPVFAPIDPSIPRPTATMRQRPLGGALIGGTGGVGNLDARLIVAGGSIYVPDHDVQIVRRTVGILSTLDYVGPLFVHDSYGTIAGALPLSAIGYVGTSSIVAPAVVVAPREFAIDPEHRDMTSVVVSDGVQEGQGAHGAFARSNTFNNMAAIGPDFKKRFVDDAPVGNVDIAPTLARVMGITLPAIGMLRGRVISEALSGGPRRPGFQRRVLRSDPASSGQATILKYQQVGSQRYVDEACRGRSDCEGALSPGTN